MLKTLIYLCIFGALVIGVQSDFLCFIQNLPSTGIDFSDEKVYEKICSDIEKMVMELTSNKNLCSFDVDVEGVKAFMLEMCDKESELHKNQHQSKACVKQVMSSENPCLPPAASLLSAQECRRAMDEQVDCLATHVATGCGEEAFKATKRGGDLSRALFRGLCSELADFFEPVSTTEVVNVSEHIGTTEVVSVPEPVDTTEVINAPEIKNIAKVVEISELIGLSEPDSESSSTRLLGNYFPWILLTFLLMRIRMVYM